MPIVLKTQHIIQSVNQSINLQSRTQPATFLCLQILPPRATLQK